MSTPSPQAVGRTGETLPAGLRIADGMTLRDQTKAAYTPTGPPIVRQLLHDLIEAIEHLTPEQICELMLCDVE